MIECAACREYYLSIYNVQQIISESSPEDRRIILDHLLATEGLPGEEELLRLRAERDLAEDAYDTLRHFVERDLAIDFEQGFGWTVDGDSEEELFGTLEAAIAKATIIDTAEKTAYIKEIQRLEAALETTRQSRLRELLEAEARKMAETWVDDDGDFCARIDDYYYVILDEDGDIHFPCVVADPDDRLIYGIAAALAEKRRREEQAALEAIPEEAWEELWADMRRCGESEVSDD